MYMCVRVMFAYAMGDAIAAIVQFELGLPQ